MGPELLDVVNALFSNEDGAAFQTNLAERLFVNSLHVTTETLDVREDGVAVAVENYALQNSLLHASPLCLLVHVQDGLVLLVLDARLFCPELKLVPS